MKKILFLLSFTLIGTIATKAQDARFSQLHSSPLRLNPSLTGVFEQDYRLTANYRNQWKNLGKPYRTGAFSAELKPVRSQSNPAIGFLAITDKAGDLNFTTNAVSLSLAGSVPLPRKRGHEHYVRAGLQFGYQSYSVDWTKLQVEFPNQVIIGLDRTGHFDSGAGITWVYATNDYLIYAGAAMFHFKGLSNSLITNGNSIVSPRYVGHLGLEMELNNTLALSLSGIYQRQRNAREIMIGGSLQFGDSQSQEENSIHIGAWYRLQDALVISARWELQNISFTASYDLTTSALSEGNNGYGAIEIGIVYTGSFINRRTRYKVICPKF